MTRLVPALFALPLCLVPPATAQTGVAIPQRFAASPGGASLSAEGLASWWKTLRDDKLNRLVEDTLLNNRDLLVAQARVAEAQARRRAAAGELWPQLSAEIGGSRAKSSELTRQGSLGGSRPVNTFSGVGQVSWEVDVFGRIRQGVRAAQAQAEASEEARRDVMVLLLSEVVSTYVELRGLQAEQGVVLENIKSQEATASLTRTRRDAGVDNNLAVAQAEGLLATTKATLPPINAAIKEAMHRLATLTGQTPDAYLKELSASARLPRVPSQIPAGLPSELLLRRPDVRQAERLVAASAAQVGQARAARLPRFALTAQGGLQSSEIDDIVDRRANLWSFGASMSIPLFTGGTLRENVRIAQAALDQARASYEQAMLVALEEVETALVHYAEAHKRLAALREAESQARKTLSLSDDLYRNGAGSFLNVLDAQRSLLQAEGQAVVAERQVVLNLVTVYKALGGGWEGLDAATVPGGKQPVDAAAPAEPVFTDGEAADVKRLTPAKKKR